MRQMKTTLEIPLAKRILMKMKLMPRKMKLMPRKMRLPKMGWQKNPQKMEVIQKVRKTTRNLMVIIKASEKVTFICIDYFLY